MAVALFGGTFNPVHIGHLRIAAELAELLGADEMRMIPCATPPHRTQPDVSAEQRMEMLQLAIGNNAILRADDTEIQRESTSYTIDTVRQIRAELGEQVPLYLCIGMDSLLTLDSWHHWQELTAYCHIVAAARPGSTEPCDGPVADFISGSRAKSIDQLQQQAHGLVTIVELTMLPVSSTAIRGKIKRKQSIDYLTPQPVIDYIQQHHLYE